MIQISKDSCPPKLFSTHLKKYDEMKKLYNGNTENYKSGLATFEFDSSYNTVEVKVGLVKNQYNKCCFSEAKFVGDYSDIEHFRPKGRIDDYFTTTKMHPGYYWLAFDWSNLYLSKTRPNQSQKRNYFPLYNESERNRYHDDINIEKPILIDPGKENPRDFINFHLDEPIGIDKDDRGKFNINFFKLRHSEFAEARREKLQFLKNSKECVDALLQLGCSKDDPIIKNTIINLQSAVLPSAEFSSMAIDFLQEWPHLK